MRSFNESKNRWGYTEQIQSIGLRMVANVYSNRMSHETIEIDFEILSHRQLCLKLMTMP